MCKCSIYSSVVGLKKKRACRLLTTVFECRFEKKNKKNKTNELKENKLDRRYIYAIQQLVTNSLAIKMNNEHPLVML